MKNIFIRLLVFFIFCFPSFAKCQKDSSQAYFKIAACFNQITPNYSNFSFRLSDPNSGVKINDAFHLRRQLNYYGIETDIAEVVKPSGLIITVFHLLATFGKTSENTTANAYCEIGTPGIGYELKLHRLTKLHNKYNFGISNVSESHKTYSRIKLRAVVNIDYAYNQYSLEKDIESKNGNAIMVNGTNFSTVTNVQVRDNIIKLTPAIGLNIRLSSSKELRFYVKYSYVFYDNEQLYKTNNNRGDLTKKFSPNEKDFLFDSNGHPISNLFSIAPLSFKIEFAFN